jgi:hypothetical protein
MTTFKELCHKAKELCTLLKPTQRQEVPAEVLSDSWHAIDRLVHELTPYLPASTQERKAAKAHPTATQIALFTTADPDRKKHFNLAYFQKAFRDIPTHERRLIVSTVPKTIAGFRDAVILYYYRAGMHTGQDLLKAFQAHVENDYHSLPHVQEFNRLKLLYRELLVARSPADVTGRLLAELADEQALVAFANANKLKMPAQKRGKNAPQTTAHERLAAVIFKKGSLARLDVG